MGRPTDYTDALAAGICEAIRAGQYKTTAARIAGLSPNTLFDWIKKSKAGIEPYVGFSDRVERAQALAEADALERIRRAGEPQQSRKVKVTKDAGGNVIETVTEESNSPGDWTASAWYLERCRPAGFQRRKSVEHKGEMHVKTLLITEPEMAEPRDAEIEEDEGDLDESELDTLND
jgi:hypothetical protein